MGFRKGVHCFHMKDETAEAMGFQVRDVPFVT